MTDGSSKECRNRRPVERVTQWRKVNRTRLSALSNQVQILVYREGQDRTKFLSQVGSYLHTRVLISAYQYALWTGNEKARKSSRALLQLQPLTKRPLKKERFPKPTHHPPLATSRLRCQTQSLEPHLPSSSPGSSLDLRLSVDQP
jgi:hypothetical protein